MPPPIALAITILLIAYAFRRDFKINSGISAAVWIPIAWLMINGSRQPSQWLGGGPVLSAQAIMEGSLLDRTFYAALIVAGAVVLIRRHARVGELVKNNLAIIIFLAYALLSGLWSDYPLTSLKRWTKALGDLVMVLVLCSDPDPVRALNAMIRRCAYVLIPVSVLFCKYYEYLGRAFDAWGNASYTGVTVDKNMLGYLLFAFGLYFLSGLIGSRGLQQHQVTRSRIDVAMDVLFIVMIGWLLAIANSKTATLSLVVGAAVLLAIRVAALRRHFWTFAIAAMLIAVIADELFSIKSAILEASGRDATLTGRTGLWETLLKEPINPLVGAGYASFWLGERLYRFWAMYPTSPPIQAHNGYLEAYLNLGLIGLCLLGFVLWRGLKTIQKRAAEAITSANRDERVLGAFGLAYGAAYLLYNVSEATFQGSNFLFTIFLLLAFNRPRDRAAPARRWSRLRDAGRQHRVDGPARLERM